MAIRKPAEAGQKSAAMAELLAGVGMDTTFKSGSIVEGTVSAVKDDDVFTDIGYKSEGIVNLGEFTDPADAVPGFKFNVMIVSLEDDRTGMLILSKKRADDKIRWEKILERYVEGCVVTGTIKSAVRGGLLVQIDDVEAFLPGSQVEVAPVKELEPYIGQTFDFKVIKISNERRNLIIGIYRHHLTVNLQTDVCHHIVLIVENIVIPMAGLCTTQEKQHAHYRTEENFYFSHNIPHNHKCDGAPETNRTSDQQLRRLLLYPLSYGSLCKIIILNFYLIVNILFAFLFKLVYNTIC